MKTKLIANGLPIVSDRYYCTYDIEKKIAEVFAPDGHQVINQFIVSFIGDEKDFLDFFQYISNIFGMRGNGQRGKVEYEKFEWFFYNHNKKIPYQIKDGDALVFDENYYGENSPAIYIKRRNLIFLLPDTYILFRFLRKESDIYAFVNTLRKFYGLTIRKTVVGENKLAWRFSAN